MIKNILVSLVMVAVVASLTGCAGMANAFVSGLAEGLGAGLTGYPTYTYYDPYANVVTDDSYLVAADDGFLVLDEGPTCIVNVWDGGTWVHERIYRGDYNRYHANFHQYRMANAGRQYYHQGSGRQSYHASSGQNYHAAAVRGNNQRSSNHNNGGGNNGNNNRKDKKK